MAQFRLGAGQQQFQRGVVETTQHQHLAPREQGAVEFEGGVFGGGADQGDGAVLDLKAEFAKLTMLKGRTPTSSEAERKGAFARLAPYRDGAIFAAKFAGTSAWERHPQGDEIVQIVDGAVTFHIMTDDGPQSHALRAGMVVIVPQGAWHRFEAPDGVSLMTATPQPTQHLTFAIDDPRTLE